MRSQITKGQSLVIVKTRVSVYRSVFLFAGIALWFCVFAPNFFAQTSPYLKWKTTAGERAVLEVHGLSRATLRQLETARWTIARWQRLLSVFAGETSAALPPMLGAYHIANDVLQFVPQFPLEPGIVYQAVFRPANLPGTARRQTPALTAAFQLPPRNTMPTTFVTQVYPSADELPENLLKFYLHFSAPMRRGGIYNYIELRDETGKQVELPFLEIDEELWDPTLTRLTLFIDPGRIKRGVKPLEEIGPSLEAGKRYSLVIKADWRDGAGNPLKSEFQKSFRVGSPDRTPPDPAVWQLTAPAAAAREALTLVFSEAMDQALAQRVITVHHQSGAPVAGTVRLEDREQRWVFTPDAIWQAGAYELRIQTTIEDLAGNNIGKPFEVDLFEGIERKLTTQSVKLSFTIR